MALHTQISLATNFLSNVLSQCKGCKASEELVYALETIDVLSSTAENDARVEEVMQKKTAIAGLRTFDVSQIKNCFQTTHFQRLLNLIFCEGFCQEWISGPLGPKIDNLLNRIVENASPAYVFLALSYGVIQSRQECSQLYCRRKLRQFLQAGRVTELLWEQARVPAGTATATARKNASQVVNPGRAVLWEDLVKGLTSLPDRMANKFLRQNQDFFLASSYIPLLGQSMLEALQRVHDCMQKSLDCSLEFISQIFGKLCLRGGAGMLWATWLPTLLGMVEKDYLWRRILVQLIDHLPPGSLEQALVPLFSRLPWYGLMEWFLGDLVISNPQVRNLLDTRLIFCRCFENNSILQNIIGYLASSPARKKIFEKLLLSVLEEWSGASALKHSAYLQHLYITKALLVCCSHFSLSQHDHCKEEVLQLLMHGVGVHLENSSSAVRRLGMVVGEVVTAAIPFNNSEPIKFEYEEDDEVASLKALLIVPEKPDIQDLGKRLETVTLKGKSKPPVEEPTKKSVPPPVPQSPLAPSPDLDSDDDLEPYDISNDPKTDEAEPPKFIRDCMEGLLCSDKPAKVEACLKATQSLIRTSIDDVDEIAEKLCKILLHLPDADEGDKGSLRLATMVTLAVRSPGPVADYLCREFYAVNYNLRQRMEMLQVLSAAATELSKPTDPNLNVKSTPTQLSQPKEVVPESRNKTDWQKEVEMRIAAKTRRFASPRLHSSGVANRFAPVAGKFFFPLLKCFDREKNTFDLLGQDTVVLVRLISTLAQVALAAVGAPIAGRIGGSLLEFICVLKEIPDLTVRLALLYASCCLGLMMPPHLLGAQPKFWEFNQWIEATAAKDPDQKCQAQAKVAKIILFENLVENMLPSDASC